MAIKNIIQVIIGLIILALLGILGTTYQYIRIKAFAFLVGGLFWTIVLIAIFLIFIGINELTD